MRFLILPAILALAAAAPIPAGTPVAPPTEGTKYTPAPGVTVYTNTPGAFSFTWSNAAGSGSAVGTSTGFNTVTVGK